MSTHLLDCIEDDYNAHVDLRRVCRSCGNLSRHLEDGWCAKRNGDEPSDGELIRRDWERAQEHTRRVEARCNRRAGF